MMSGIPSERETTRPNEVPMDPAGWVDAHADALYRYARSRLRSRQEAEDLVQETFLAALRAMGRFEGRASTRTWLLAILRRRIADHHRRPRDARAEGLEQPQGRPAPRRWFNELGAWIEAPARWASPEVALRDRELREALEQCVDRLPAHLGDAFVLREAEGMETVELCRTLKLSAANLRVRLHRARLLLRECLERTWLRGDAESTNKRSSS